MNRYAPATPESNSEINLTPMLDVVFILLIFFVVTASFLKDLGVDVTLPAGLDQAEPDVTAIVVSVDYDDGFHVNGRALARGSLVPYIRRLSSENPGAPFSVVVSPDAHVEATVIAVDAGRQAGFSTIPIREQP